VLEPSAGDGAFFALRQRGAEVVGIEIDRALPGRAQVGDFFAYPLDEQFDTIVGNPPYVRYQDVAGKRKSLNSDLFDARSNLFLFFIEKACAT
jgi:adenine-specific DNA-methyltransferase